MYRCSLRNVVILYQHTLHNYRCRRAKQRIAVLQPIGGARRVFSRQTRRIPLQCEFYKLSTSDQVTKLGKRVEIMVNAWDLFDASSVICYFDCGRIWWSFASLYNIIKSAKRSSNDFFCFNFDSVFL